MVGCMVATSLAMAPAMLVAQRASVVDLDGPLLLAKDRPGGLRYVGSTGLSRPSLHFGVEAGVSTLEPVGIYDRLMARTIACNCALMLWNRFRDRNVQGSAGAVGLYGRGAARKRNTMPFTRR